MRSSRTTFWLVAAVTLMVGSSAGCGLIRLDDLVPKEEFKIEGKVFSTRMNDSEPLEGARMMDGPPQWWTKTDARGRYSYSTGGNFIEQTKSRGNRVRADGHARVAKLFETYRGHTSYIRLSVPRYLDSKSINLQKIDIEERETISTDVGFEFVVPKFALVDAEDEPVTGDVRVKVAIHGWEMMSTFIPWPTKGADPDGDGFPVMDVYTPYAHVEFSQNKRPVRLKDGKNIEVSYTGPADELAGKPDKLTLRTYSHQPGGWERAWYEHGEATRQSVGAGTSAYSAEADMTRGYFAFTREPQREMHTVDGKVVRAGGQPAVGAEVVGMRRAGGSVLGVRDTADTEGHFKLVLPAEQVELSVYHDGRTVTRQVDVNVDVKDGERLEVSLEN